MDGTEPAASRARKASGGDIAPPCSIPECKNQAERRARREGGWYTRCTSHRKHKTASGGRAVFATISPAEWDRVYQSQGGLCAVCLAPLRHRYRGGEGKVAAVDHDHIIERALKRMGYTREQAIRRSIRALLCTMPCNQFWVEWYTAERVRRMARVCDMPAQGSLDHAEAISGPHPKPEDIRAAVEAARAPAERRRGRKRSDPMLIP